MKKADFEQIFPITISSYYYIARRKPLAVLSGDERVDATTWTKVYTVILSRCNQDLRGREMLMYLREKAAGKCRVFLSDKPDNMRRPVKIDNELWECYYGSATLMHILCEKILSPAHFDYSDIRIVLKKLTKGAAL